eukprot:TRINITY_DN49923_c0_g1_i1.p1 TRINITY_DN49923_c0_g1~~TRINITY_DN49923_c0_g1_i1.p1  ORF type:complete len:481 (+),score=101.41 TRINITY_DN49923_c0_g1_i1:160-1443(+)
MAAEAARAAAMIQQKEVVATVVPPGSSPAAAAATAARAAAAGHSVICGDYQNGHCTRGAGCRYAHARPQAPAAVPVRAEPEDAMPLWDSCDAETMSLEYALHRNICGDHYYKSLFRCGTVAELIEEAKEEARAVNAWGPLQQGDHLLGDRKSGDFLVIGRKKTDMASHTNETPTRTWCVLFKLFQLRPSERQLRSLIGENSKAILRAIGVLYLRFTQPPATLLEWYRPLLDDDKTRLELRPGTHVTMAAFVRSVMLEQCYLETRFPRIPERILRDFRVALGEEDAVSAQDMAARRRGEHGERDQEERKQAAAARRRAGGRLDLIDDDRAPKRRCLTPREREQARSEQLAQRRQRPPGGEGGHKPVTWRRGESDRNRAESPASRRAAAERTTAAGGEGAPAAAAAGRARQRPAAGAESVLAKLAKLTR